MQSLKNLISELWKNFIANNINNNIFILNNLTKKQEVVSISDIEKQCKEIQKKINSQSNEIITLHWQRGQILKDVDTIYGENTLGKIAQKIGVSVATLRGEIALGKKIRTIKELKELREKIIESNGEVWNWYFIYNGFLRAHKNPQIQDGNAGVKHRQLEKFERGIEALEWILEQNEKDVEAWGAVEGFLNNIHIQLCEKCKEQLR